MTPVTCRPKTVHRCILGAFGLGVAGLLAAYALISVPQPNDLATAQAQTRDLLLALRAHMKKAVDDGTDISTAVKSFNGQLFAHLKHADVWIPQLANMTYLEMERE